VSVASRRTTREEKPQRSSKGGNSIEDLSRGVHPDVASQMKFETKVETVNDVKP